MFFDEAVALLGSTVTEPIRPAPSSNASGGLTRRLNRAYYA